MRSKCSRCFPGREVARERRALLLWSGNTSGLLPAANRQAPHPNLPPLHPLSALPKKPQTFVLTLFSYLGIHSLQPWLFSPLPSSCFLFSSWTSGSLMGRSLQWLMSTRSTHSEGRDSSFHSLIIFMNLGLRSQRGKEESSREDLDDKKNSREGEVGTSPSLTRNRVNQ